MAVRSLLARVARLEQVRAGPWAALIGTPDQFASECQRGIDEGQYDRRDMPVVVMCVTRWMGEGLWR